jgi:hypothetical protein
MRYALIVGYCVLLGVLTVWIVKRNGAETLAFVAAQPLPLNRLLKHGDVTPATWYKPLRVLRALGPSEDEFVGRYVMGDVAQGVYLRRDVTDVVPNLSPQPGEMLVIARLPRKIAGGINAEDCVHLDGDATQAIKVRAVLCPAAEQAHCAAALSVPTAQLAGLQALVGKAALSVTEAAPCP